MIKKLFFAFVFLFFVASKASAQNDYLKGYYLTKQGLREECFLLYDDLKDINNKNVIEIKTKKELANGLTTVNKSILAELGIDNQVRYQFFSLASSNIPAALQSQLAQSSGAFGVFLKLIVEGDVSLYALEYEGDTYFFYKLNTATSVTLLQYDKNATTRSTNDYRRQLFEALNSDQYQMNDFVKLKYQEEDLRGILKRHNGTKNKVSKEYSSNLYKSRFIFTVLANVNSVSFNVQGTGFEIAPFSKENKTTFGIGFETTYRFSPKIGLMGRLEYESASFEVVSDRRSSFVTDTFNFETNQLNLVLAPRYYLPVNATSEFFVNGGLGICFPFSKEIIYTNSNSVASGSTDFSSIINPYAYFNFGVGYTYKNKISLEFQLDTNRNYFSNDSTTFKTQYKRMALSLKYNLN